MAMSEREIINLFEQEVPESFLRKALRVLYLSYNGSLEDCALHFDIYDPELHDMLPIYRRAKIEKQIRELAEVHPGVSVLVEKNSTSNSNHTVVIGGRVFLTVSSVATPQTMVRRAEFRQTYAQAPTLDLFRPEEPPVPGAPLYAILLHGGQKLTSKVPCFANIAIPDQKCENYLTMIDLMKKFPEVGGEFSHLIEEELVPDALRTPLRKQTKLGEE